MKLCQSIPLLVALMGVAIGPRAQSLNAGVTESTDPAKVAAIEREAQAMKDRQTQRAMSGQAQSSAFIVRGTTDTGLQYLSGGITIQDRMAMFAERGRFSLWVATVAKPSGAYLSDARLRIVELKGGTVVLERTMDGPWFLVALPSGRYEITATVPPDGPDAAQTCTARVTVTQRGQRQAVLRFASSAEVGQEAASPFKGNPFGHSSTDM